MSREAVVPFDSERVAAAIEAFMQGLDYRSEEWVVIPRVTYHRMRLHPVKEFRVRIKPMDEIGDRNATELLLAKRPYSHASHHPHLDQIELLTYAWNICLWVQEAAARTMHHHPYVGLICHTNPFAEVQVKMRLFVFDNKTKSIF